jgi:hypothetical protein
MPSLRIGAGPGILSGQHMRSAFENSIPSWRGVRAGIGERGRRLLVHLVQACLAAGVLIGGAQASEVLKIARVGDNVYTLVGPLSNRNAENLGNNANFGVVLTDEGVVLIDSGGSHKGAQMIHAAVRKITDQPITLVVNTGGQDHRWLGNGYFKAQGSRVIAHEEAVNDQKARARDQLIALDNLIGPEGLAGTEPVYADETFSQDKTLTMGKTRIIVGHAGHAHTPGDSYVWLPEQRILFSGSTRNWSGNEQASPVTKDLSPQRPRGAGVSNSIGR